MVMKGLHPLISKDAPFVDKQEYIITLIRA